MDISMRSINQIFKHDKDTMNIPSVSELINYCRELEDQVIYNNQKVSKEDVLLGFVKDLYNSILEVLNNDKRNKDCDGQLINLKNYILEMSKDYDIRLH